MTPYPLILTIFFQAIVILLCIALIYSLFTFYRVYHSKIHLESAFDSIDDPLAVIDSNYKLLRVNRPYISLTGLTYRNVLGEKCYSVLRGRSSPCDDCKLMRVITTGSKLYVPQSPHPKNPKQPTISLTFYPFFDKKGDKPCIIEHIRDITELELFRSNLERQNKRLSETTTTLQRAQKDINEELALARQVQQKTMPQKTPDFPGLKIFHTYHPIEAVGADIYDFIQFTQNKLGIFIGDVSGHGLSSAFVSTISKMSLYQHRKNKMPTNHLLNNLNLDLIGNVGMSHYLTCFWGIFDKRDNSFTYSRAGHPMPVVIRENGDTIKLSAQGTFLGVLDSPFFEQKRFFFKKGDRCILFTDGIYEVMEIIDGKPLVFGYKKFLDTLASFKDIPINELIPCIQKKFSTFTHEDDYTLIAFDITEDQPQNLSEELPGFSPENDISFFSFTSMIEIDNYLKFLSKQMYNNKFNKEIIKRAEYCITKLIAIVIESYEQDFLKNAVTVVHAFTHKELKICIKGENTVFQIDEKFADNLLINSKGNAVSFSILRG